MSHGARLLREPHGAARDAPTCAPAGTRAAASRSWASRAEAEDVERRRVRAGRAAAGGRRRWRWARGRARPGSRGRYARSLPARRPARPRGAGGDARDGHHAGATSTRLYAAVGERPASRAVGARHAAARDVPRVPPLPLGSLALLHLPGPPGADEPLAQWRAAKAAASDAIVADGRHDHPPPRRSAATTAPWMPAEVGALGVEVLRAAKAALDPAGVMNPGKLLPPPSGRRASSAAAGSARPGRGA